ncbi:hypothetical protein [Pararhodobacter sp. CCB-MM2]|uniref:hypothetical protein n=1 Tax=Pararhodobacter sp. CCB-MM2 TaxID=1786003 RepID=UPI00082F6F18|nr:hypothetical protein [Pararhodobacter sp. CCB-MM2]
MLRLTLLAIAMGTALAYSAHAAQTTTPPLSTATGSAVLMPVGRQLSGVTVTVTLPADKAGAPTGSPSRRQIAAMEAGEKPVQEWTISD